MRNRQLLKGESTRGGNEEWHSRQRTQHKQRHGDGERQSMPSSYVLSGLVVGTRCEATWWEFKTRELNPVLVVEGLNCQLEAVRVDPEGHG